MRLNLLLVEDSEDDARLIVRTLTKEGFDVASQRVFTRETMRTALAGSSWDVVLADHSMPEFNALTALKVLQETGQDLPFIVVSGLIGEDVAVAAMKAGAHDYIMKGNLKRLVPAIRRELQEATVRAERRAADIALHAAYAELERRVEERTVELSQANEELAASNEELASANEELAAAGEELAAANEELRVQQEREITALKDADRQKDEFLSVAAHELKTPVTSLVGFAQTLRRQFDKAGTVDPERLSRALDVMVRQSEKLAAFVSQLLDFSRIEGGRLTLDRRRVDLVRVMEEVASSAKVAERNEITFQTPPQAEAFVDPMRIEQVIINLLGNALRYGAPPIEVTLTAGDPLRIAVRDHGSGIPPEHTGHIFERFYQCHNGVHTSGLGLGLYISQQIVHLHGGQIEVESPADGGARFVVIFPSGLAQ